MKQNGAVGDLLGVKISSLIVALKGFPETF
jgi:hypothetical protein